VRRPGRWCAAGIGESRKKKKNYWGGRERGTRAVSFDLGDDAPNTGGNRPFSYVYWYSAFGVGKKVPSRAHGNPNGRIGGGSLWEGTRESGKLGKKRNSSDEKNQQSRKKAQSVKQMSREILQKKAQGGKPQQGHGQILPGKRNIPIGIIGRMEESRTSAH